MPEPQIINKADKITEFLLILLIIFSPIFYGSIGIFHYTMNGFIIFLIAYCWILKMHHSGRISIVKVPFYLPVSLFILLIIFQMVTIPRSVLGILSPRSLNFYANFSSSVIPLKVLLPISMSPEHTFIELFKLISYFTVFFVVINVVESKQQFQRIFNVIILSGVIISIIGVVQKYSLSYSGRVNWSIISSTSYSFGPFFNRNHFAGYLEMVIPLTVGYLLTDIEINKKIFYGLGGAIMSLALFFSLSRSGILVFVATLLFIAVFSARKKELRNATVSILFLFVVILFTSFFVLDVDIIAERFKSTFANYEQISLLGRGYLWRDILKIWRDFPIFGSGLGTFASLSNKYSTLFAHLKFIHAHNDYLQLLSEVGIFGFGFMAMFFFLYFNSLIRMWLKRKNRYVLGMALGGMAAVWAILLHSMVDFNLHIPSNAILFFIIMGLTYRIAFTRFKKDNVLPRDLG